jgi:hypothetical protein
LPPPKQQASSPQGRTPQPAPCRINPARRALFATHQHNRPLIPRASSKFGYLEWKYQHEAVNHADTYVKGQVHTNGLENFWSLMKRNLSGTYVSVEQFHLDRYLDEQVFRFNNRATKDNPLRQPAQ